MNLQLFNLINLKVTDYFIIVSLNGILTALVSWWIKIRLEHSIKHEYEKRLEDYKFEFRKREQAAKVAELFSLLYSDLPQTPDDPQTEVMNASNYHATINRIAWELSLWLPAGIVRGLSSSLSNAPGGKDPKQILIEIRKVLLGKNDDLKAEEIVHFTETHNTETGQHE
jgi:hypothetical protein